MNTKTSVYNSLSHFSNPEELLLRKAIRLTVSAERADKIFRERYGVDSPRLHHETASKRHLDLGHVLSGAFTEH